MRIIPAVAVAAAALLTGCVAVQDYPNTRPMSAETLKAISKTQVVVAESNNGIEKSWFMTDSSATGAQYGLIGGIVSGIMDAIMNAGPSRRASQAAGEIAKLVPAETLTASLVWHLQSQVPPEGGAVTGVSVAGVSTAQKITAPQPVDRAVEVRTSYMLSEDASAFRVIAHVSLQGKDLPYQTPYQFKTVPKSELTGPVYRNTFTYHSAQLPVPTLTPELRARLIASIKEGYRDANGAAPAADSQEGKAMAKEIEAANDEKLSKDEVAIFLTREWVKDGGAMLKREVENAHGFIAKYLVQDLNSTTVPDFKGQDRLAETTDQRSVRQVGAGIEAGTYVSAPANLTSFTTYGNATAIAKVHSERIDALNKQVAAQKQAATKKKKA
jgi:hypothetical protein